MKRHLPTLVLAVVALGAACEPPLAAAASPVAQQEQQGKRSDEEVRSEIQKRIANEPQLKGFSIRVIVDRKHVIMGGVVHSLAQRDLALEIGRSFAEGREVIDDFSVIPHQSRITPGESPQQPSR